MQLEPKKHFKKAIHHKKPNGLIVYDYEKLINVTSRAYNLNRDDSIDWVEFNICTMASMDTFLIWYSDDLSCYDFPKIIFRKIKIGNSVFRRVKITIEDENFADGGNWIAHIKDDELRRFEHLKDEQINEALDSIEDILSEIRMNWECGIEPSEEETI